MPVNRESTIFPKLAVLCVAELSAAKRCAKAGERPPHHKTSEEYLSFYVVCVCVCLNKGALYWHTSSHPLTVHTPG
jgi:hypothetical protein